MTPDYPRDLSDGRRGCMKVSIEPILGLYRHDSYVTIASEMSVCRQ